MALPTPETLAPGIATVEAALAQVEANERAKAFAITSTDGNFTAVANGDVSLASVSFSDTQSLVRFLN